MNSPKLNEVFTQADPTEWQGLADKVLYTTNPQQISWQYKEYGREYKVLDGFVDAETDFFKDCLDDTAMALGTQFTIEVVNTLRTYNRVGLLLGVNAVAALTSPLNLDQEQGQAVREGLIEMDREQVYLSAKAIYEKKKNSSIFNASPTEDFIPDSFQSFRHMTQWAARYTQYMYGSNSSSDVPYRIGTGGAQLFFGTLGQIVSAEPVPESTPAD